VSAAASRQREWLMESNQPRLSKLLKYRFFGEFGALCNRKL
jgi:hypothetical protein